MVMALPIQCLMPAGAIRGFAEALVLASVAGLAVAGVEAELVVAGFGSKVNR